MTRFRYGLALVFFFGGLSPLAVRGDSILVDESDTWLISQSERLSADSVTFRLAEPDEGEVLLETPAPGVVVEEAPAVAPAPAPIAAPPKAKLFTGQFELGLNGASGNSEQFSMRVGFVGKREGPKADSKVTINYNKATNGGTMTQNLLFTEVRNEWKLGQSKWRIYDFINGTYDEFQDWDVRVVMGAGLAYEWIKTDRTKFLTRFGPGVSREIGGRRNEWIPELNTGFDLEHKITDRQSASLNFDYYPSLIDFSDYRTQTKVAWECVIDPEKNISLRVGALNRYQSMPGPGRKTSDLNYYAEILWKF